MLKFCIFLIAAIVFAYTAVVVFHQTFAPTQRQPVPELQACTLDAMQCPDGSWVGRTGPQCEFVCPDKNPGV